VNKVDERVHAAEYENLISGLRNEVATLKHKLAATGGLMNATLSATLVGGGFIGVLGEKMLKIYLKVKKKMKSSFGLVKVMIILMKS
jgi:hypothetical protein